MVRNKNIQEIVTDFRIVADRLMEQAKAEKSVKATAAAVETATKAYRFAIELAEVNTRKTVREFMNEFLMTVSGGESRAIVYKSYLDFCKIADTGSVSKSDFFQAMESAGFSFYKTNGEFKVKLPRNKVIVIEEQPKLVFD